MRSRRRSVFVVVVLAWATLSGCRGCKKEPALRLTYDVDVTAAYDGAKDEAAVMQAARTAVDHRLAALLGRRAASVTTQGRHLIVELAALDAAQLREVETVIGRSGRVAFELVDDDADLFGKVADAALPDGEGISIFVEQAPAGLDASGRPKTVMAHYARIAMRPAAHATETMAACLERFRRWTGTLAMPADHEVAYEAVRTFDPDTRTSSDEGWRTFYLFRRAELTNASISDATVQSSVGGADAYYVALTFDSAGSSASRTSPGRTSSDASPSCSTAWSSLRR
jgi:preprotein translocase subunit SecD